MTPTISATPTRPLTPAEPLSLILRKYAPEIAPAGAPFTYTLQVTNSSSVAIQNVTVRDVVPTEAALQVAPGGSIISLPTGNQQLTWMLSQLDAGQSLSVHFVVTATQSLVNAQYDVQMMNGDQVLGSEPVLTLVGSTASTATVDPANGAVVTVPNQPLAVTFPPGAVTSPVNVTVMTTPPIMEFGFVGVAFSVEAIDQAGNRISDFAQPLTLVVEYTDLDLQNSGITDEQTINLYYWNGAQWIAILPCSGCQLDTGNNRITAMVNHLTLFALRKSNRILLPLVMR